MVATRTKVKWAEFKCTHCGTEFSVKLSLEDAQKFLAYCPNCGEAFHVIRIDI